MENSIKTLSNAMRRFYVLSIGFDEIYYGIKNPKRFKLCILFCIIMWIAAIWHFILITPPVWLSIDTIFT